MTRSEFEKEILKAIEDATRRFENKMPGVSKAVLGKIQELIRDLQIKNGVILDNTANLKKIGQMRALLERVIASPEYREAVSSFLKSFDEVAKLQASYFRSTFGDLPFKEKLDLIQKQAKDAVVQKLLGSGLDANVVMKVEDILRTNITTGGTFGQLYFQMAEFLLGQAGTGIGGLGKLSGYASQIVTDALNQFSAQYHDTISMGLGLKWYMYVGSNIETTREFCEAMTDKTYVYESELPEIIKGHIDDHDVKINPKTKLWYGAIEGTNTSNLKINRGGYKCGHQFIAVAEAVVPRDIRIATYNKFGVKHENGKAA